MKRLIRRGITTKLADLKWQGNKCEFWELRKWTKHFTKSQENRQQRGMSDCRVRGEKWKSLWTVGSVVTRLSELNWIIWNPADCCSSEMCLQSEKKQRSFPAAPHQLLSEVTNSSSLTDIIRFPISTGMKSKILPNGRFCFTLWQQILCHHFVGQLHFKRPSSKKGKEQYVFGV